MFQWDAVDNSPDLVSQNVLKTFERAIGHNRWTTRTELERVFCCWLYFHSRSKNILLALFRGGGRSPPSPPRWICHCVSIAFGPRHFCLTVLTISYVDSYRDVDSYVTILPSLPTWRICGP